MERRQEWADEDLTEVEGERVVTDEAWERALRGQDGELRALVVPGGLEARGTAAWLRLRAGSFDDWLDEPVPMLTPWGGEYEAAPEGEERSLQALAGARVDRLREGVQAKWQELRALEVVLEGARGEFEEEDPAPSAIRETLDDIRAALERLHTDLESFAGPFDLPKPTEGLLALTRRAR